MDDNQFWANQINYLDRNLWTIRKWIFQVKLMALHFSSFLCISRITNIFVHLRVNHENPSLCSRQNDSIIRRQIIAKKAIHVPRLNSDLKKFRWSSFDWLINRYEILFQWMLTRLKTTVIWPSKTAMQTANIHESQHHL